MAQGHQSRQQELDSILATLTHIGKAIDDAPTINGREYRALLELVEKAKDVHKTLTQAYEANAAEQAALKGKEGLAATFRSILRAPSTWMDLTKLKKDLEKCRKTVDALRDRASKDNEVEKLLKKLEDDETPIRSSIDHFNKLRQSMDQGAMTSQQQVSSGSGSATTANSQQTSRRDATQTSRTGIGSAGSQVAHPSRGPLGLTEQQGLDNRISGTRRTHAQPSLGRVPEDAIAQQPRGDIPQSYNSFGNPATQYRGGAPAPPGTIGGPWHAPNQGVSHPCSTQSGPRSSRTPGGPPVFIPPGVPRDSASMRSFGITAQRPNATFSSQRGLVSSPQAQPQVHHPPPAIQGSRRVYHPSERAQEWGYGGSFDEISYVPQPLSAPPARRAPASTSENAQQQWTPAPQPQEPGRGHIRNISDFSALRRHSSGSSASSGYPVAFSQGSSDGSRPGTAASAGSGLSYGSYDPSITSAPFPPHSSGHYTAAQPVQATRSSSSGSRRSSSSASGGHHHRG